MNQMITMEQIEQAYVTNEDEYYYGVYDYQPMLAMMGDIVVQVDDNDYQGDSRLLFKDDDARYGFLRFGWGSCSGCDSLQACTSKQEVLDLARELQNDIEWFKNKDAAILWFQNHDWEGDYDYHSKETQDFIKQVIEYLQA